MKNKPIARMIDGVRVVVTPGSFPEFHAPRTMNGQSIDEWKIKNAQEIKQFIEIVDRTILDKHFRKLMAVKRAKELERKTVKNKEIADYTPRNPNII